MQNDLFCTQGSPRGVVLLVYGFESDCEIQTEYGDIWPKYKGKMLGFYFIQWIEYCFDETHIFSKLSKFYFRNLKIHQVFLTVASHFLEAFVASIQLSSS